jgi:hypothetical protein
VTPPEDTDRRGGGTADQTAGAVTPPWQRVGKDAVVDGNGPTVEMASAGYAGWSAEQGRGDDVRYRETGDHGPAGAEQTTVTGTAAGNLFGGPQEESPRGREQGPGARGRATPTALRRPGRGPRRASLQIKRFDPWSVLKLSLVLGVALFFIWLVAVGVLYTVLDGMGVWDKLNGTYTSLVQGEGTAAAGEPLISAGRVFGIAAIVGAINIVLLSALATVSAFIYNVSADLAGGLEVTLSERD